MKNLLYVTVILLGVMSMRAAFAEGPCPQDHCSKNSVELNNDCVKSGLAGQKIHYPMSSGGFCYCNCSCYAQSTKVWANGSETAVEKIGKHSEVANPTGYAKINAVIKSPVENSPALELVLSNGNAMILSKNHALVTEGGIVMEAETVSAGTHLLGGKGELVEVVSVRPVTYSGTFYNFITDGSDASGTDRILLSEGVQSGDWTIQSFRDYANANVSLKQLIANIEKAKAKH